MISSLRGLFKKLATEEGSSKSGGVYFDAIHAPLLNEQILSDLATQAQNIKISQGYTQRLESHFSGTLPSKQIGSGMDYAESREYQAGDDPRFINWRLTARSNETLVKTFHTESSPTMCILMDRRNTMHFGTRTQLKITQAAKITALLSYAAQQHRLALSGLILDNDNPWFAPSTNQQTFASWLVQINSPCPPEFSHEISTDAGKIDWQLTLQNLTVKNPLGSLIYLISDFEGLAEKHQRYLEELQSHHHVIAIHISDPAEHALSNNGKIRLQSSQSNTQFQVDSSDAKQQKKYQAQTRLHHESIKQLFKKRGIDYVSISTSDDALTSLIPLPLEASA